MTSALIRLFLIPTLFLSLTDCTNRADKGNPSDVSIDTTQTFLIDNYRVTPKVFFDFHSSRKSISDTLHIVTCSDYVYFPFGKLTDRSSLKNSLLKGFKIIRRKLDSFTAIGLPSDPSDDFKQWSETLELEFGANKLSLFLDNDPEASIHSYIRGGQIVDDKVTFLGDIKVGMNLQEFYGRFFDYFPEELLDKYSVVKFESCLTDIIHIYTFNNGQLKSVKFLNY